MVTNLLCRAEHFPTPCPNLPGQFGRGFFLAYLMRKLVRANDREQRVTKQGNGLA